MPPPLLGQHAPAPPPSRQSKPSGHDESSPTVHDIEHFISSPIVRQTFDWHIVAIVQSTPRPLPENGCAMQVPLKHRPPLHSASPVQLPASTGAVARRNCFSMLVRVS